MKNRYLLTPPYPDDETNPFGIEISAQICLLITTVSDIDQAKQLCESLINQRLAACVQIDKITSIYQWKNQLQEDDECRLVIKTPNFRQDEVVYFLQENHPYDLPEIIITPFAAEKDYYDWCVEMTS